MMRSPLSSVAMLATTTAFLLLLAVTSTPRSVLGSPLRVGDKERQKQEQELTPRSALGSLLDVGDKELQEQEQEQEQQLDYYIGDDDEDSESSTGDVGNLADPAPLDGDDYVLMDDENAGGDQLPTHSGRDLGLLGNLSQEARSAKLALFVEFLARLLHELRAPNSSMSLSEALTLSSARAADQHLCADHFFKHFFGISSCGGIGRHNDTGDSVGHLETVVVDESTPAYGEKGFGLRSDATNALDALLGTDIDDDRPLFAEA